MAFEPRFGKTNFNSARPANGLSYKGEPQYGPKTAATSTMNQNQPAATGTLPTYKGEPTIGKGLESTVSKKQTKPGSNTQHYGQHYGNALFKQRAIANILRSRGSP